MEKGTVETKMDLTPDQVASTSAAYWAAKRWRIKLQKGVFSFDGRQYLLEPMQCADKGVRRRCFMKGTQGGFPIDVNTPIPTPGGWVLMRDIEPGESVFGSDGKIYRVLKAHDIQYGSKCYRVCFSDGSSIVCDKDHLWSLTDEFSYKKIKQATVRTSQIARAKKKGNRNRYVLDVAKPLQLKKRNLPIHPYVLGLWLGDGNSYSAQFTCSVADSESYGSILRSHGISDFDIRQIDKRYPNVANIKLNGYHNKLVKLGVLKNKHIPMQYLRASYKQRLRLLQGLIDTDGHITKSGKIEFYNINRVLLAQVKELILSLGFKAKLSAKAYSTNWGATELKAHKVYRITFRAYSDSPVARLFRKYKNQRSRAGSRTTETERRRIVKVVPVESVPVRCIETDAPNHLFLAGEDFIPTHNTEEETNEELHGLIHGRYPRGVLVLFPSKDEVSEFSKARFGPLIAANPTAIGQYVKDTDTANLKRIGDAFLYLRGATLTKALDVGNKESAKLRSISVDKVRFEELDLFDQDSIAKALERMGDSTVKAEVYVSNPTTPDFGIAAKYDQSDQRHWFRYCPCGGWTCAELEFPNYVMLDKKTGKGYIACEKCGKPLSNEPGEWVPAERANTEYMQGYQWSQLTSRNQDPWEILQLYNNPPDGNIADIVRFKLGKPYISAHDRLTTQAVLSCCGDQHMLDAHPGPCAMGVDVKQSHKNVVIGIRSGPERYRILRVARCSDRTEVKALHRRFNVKSCVIDIRPLEDWARELQKDLRGHGRTYLCEYKESSPVGAVFHDNTGLVTPNRNEICDASHRLVADGRMLELPAKCPEIVQFARECCTLAKVEVIDKKTKSTIFRYIKLKADTPDDYRHALNYFYLAASGHRVGVVDGQRRRRSSHAKNEYVRA